jgi:hypothetical protein
MNAPASAIRVDAAGAGEAGAWFVYGLRPTPGTPPVGEAILPDCAVEIVPVGGFTVLASSVPRRLFDRGDPQNRTADPDWMAARVRAYHTVNAAAAEAPEPFLPLAFGTLFSSLDLLADWLAPRAVALRAALGRVAGRREWLLTLEADQAAHAAWLDANDTALQALAASVAAAGEGTAFLLARRLDKTREAARARHAARAADLVAAALDRAKAREEAGAKAGADLTVLAETPRGGGAAWSILAPSAASSGTAWSAPLADVAADLAPTGLVLRLTGPWPAYAFARAALAEEAVDG